MAQYFQSDQWVDSYIGAVRDVVTKPGEFFSGLPRATAYGPAIFFFSVTLAVPLLIFVLMSFGIMLLVAPFVWLLALAATWIWAWYLGWAVRSFAKQELDTIHAFQISAYANVPMLISWVPTVGLFATIWSIALQWFGLTRNCGVSSGVALAILLVPMLIISISLGVLVMLLGIFAAQHGIQMPIQI